MLDRAVSVGTPCRTRCRDRGQIQGPTRLKHQACVTQQAGYRQAAKYQPDIRPAVSWPSVRLLAYLRNGTWRNRKTKRHNRMSVKTLVILMSALAGIAAMAGGPCAADHDPAAKIFNTYCSPCHGETGGGNGPIGDVLARRPRNFTDCDQMKKLSDDHIFKVIKEGGRGAGLKESSSFCIFEFPRFVHSDPAWTSILDRVGRRRRMDRACRSGRTCPRNWRR